tara:strand:- start:9 stop:335 length:327 start_codon:yes stop_codon:yes gene_type:complete
MDTLQKTEMTTEEKIYDHFSYTVAYVKDGRVELDDTTRVVLVKKGSRFASVENREKVLKDIEEYVFEDGCDDPYYRDFQYIYRGCKRMVHIEGQKPRVLKQTSLSDLI